jgi:hypothetical protein
MCASSVRRAIGTVWSSATFRLRLAAAAEDGDQCWPVHGRYLGSVDRETGSWRLDSFVLRVLARSLGGW